MKLAFVNQPLGPIRLPINSGSLGIWIYQVARRLAADFDVSVYSILRPGLAETESYEGVRYRRVHAPRDEWIASLLDWRTKLLPRSGPSFASDRFYRGYLDRIAAEIARDEPDFIFLFNFPQYVPVLKKARPQAKVVLKMDCEWLTQLDRTWVAGRIDAADLILGTSEYISGKIRERFPEFSRKIRTLGNGVDIDHIRPAGTASPASAGSGDPVVLFVGRISPEKGLHVLIDAFARVVRDVPESRLDLVGPEWLALRSYIVGLSDDEKVAGLARYYAEPYGQILRRRVAELKLGDKVRFVGLVPHEKLAEIYAASALLVNPSLSEAFGGTLVEGMAAGVPVIASRVGGMPEKIQDGTTGVLVDADDSAALADAIVRLLRDPAARDRIGAAARRWVTETFSWERVCGGLLAWYAEVDPRIANVARREPVLD